MVSFTMKRFDEDIHGWSWIAFSVGGMFINGESGRHQDINYATGADQIRVQVAGRLNEYPWSH